LHTTSGRPISKKQKPLLRGWGYPAYRPLAKPLSKPLMSL